MWDSLTGQPLTTCARGVVPQSKASPKPQVVPTPSTPSLRVQRRLRHSSAFRKFNASLQANEPSASLAESSGSVLPSIWAVDIAEDLILLGCDNGRVEVHQILTNLKMLYINVTKVWDALTGLHRCQHDDAGSTAVIFTLILPLQDSNIHLFISSHFHTSHHVCPR